MKLWDSQVLNIHDPNGLLNCVFFYDGKLLGLRGGEEHRKVNTEHRKLKFSQFTREHRVVVGQQKACSVYTEHGSKNHSGGVRQLHQNNKVVHHFEIPEAGERDYVRILDLYFSKVPKDSIERDSFYLRPLPKLGLQLLINWAIWLRIMC